MEQLSTDVFGISLSYVSKAQRYKWLQVALELQRYDDARYLIAAIGKQKIEWVCFASQICACTICPQGYDPRLLIALTNNEIFAYVEPALPQLVHKFLQKGCIDALRHLVTCNHVEQKDLRRFVETRIQHRGLDGLFANVPFLRELWHLGAITKKMLRRQGCNMYVVCTKKSVRLLQFFVEDLHLDLPRWILKYTFDNHYRAFVYLLPFVTAKHWKCVPKVIFYRHSRLTHANMLQTIQQMMPKQTQQEIILDAIGNGQIEFAQYVMTFTPCHLNKKEHKLYRHGARPWLLCCGTFMLCIIVLVFVFIQSIP